MEDVQAAEVNLKKVLIVSDEIDRLGRLKSMLKPDQVEISSATTLDEVKRGCESEHDLALVDVSPDHLQIVLNYLRTSPRNTEIPVLVDVERTAMESSLAGVLPRFRAMPCNQSQMAQLSNRWLRNSFTPFYPKHVF